MPKLIHPVAGGLALSLIALFWLSTVAVELSGSQDAVAAVKQAIPYGFILLVPAMLAVGASGASLGSKRQGDLVRAKKRRMPIIAANGLLILIPSALFLAAKAARGEFDTVFIFVQALELVAGGVNIALMALKMRDGLRLTRRRSRRMNTRVLS
ncbi:hypothetical protein [Jiella marina]|uniref:hypothetical protein n=1 Tax=Jiella sp. LLJ827 TaxID=2917712 RepID=UPI002100D857|nr:hypothetical protein [Jiella sp. LLJ827]MCQ0989655.1 hypothetical protein [Jiella sp. LLJ827]